MMGLRDDGGGVSVLDGSGKAPQYISPAPPSLPIKAGDRMRAARGGSNGPQSAPMQHPARVLAFPRRKEHDARDQFCRILSRQAGLRSAERGNDITGSVGPDAA